MPTWTLRKATNNVIMCYLGLFLRLNITSHLLRGFGILIDGNNLYVCNNCRYMTIVVKRIMRSMIGSRHNIFLFIILVKIPYLF